MDRKKLEKYLWNLNYVEEYQLKNKRNYNYMNIDFINQPIAKMPGKNFFKEKSICVTKSSRYSYVPAHTHSFIELNYSYSGKSIQHVDDQKIILRSGNLLMMDTEVIQRIDYANTDDILLNILIDKEIILSKLANWFSNKDFNNSVISFLKNSSNQNLTHDNYMIFDLNKDMIAKNLVESIIANEIDSNSSSQLLTENLFILLIRILPNCIIKKNVNFVEVKDDKFVAIIEYINQHYETITLKELSEHFHYNMNYLGNLIKEKTGRTFKEILEFKRLTIAQSLMIKTNYSINKISEIVGFKNFSSLYRLFKKYLNMSPTDYKLKVDPNYQNKNKKM